MREGLYNRFQTRIENLDQEVREIIIRENLDQEVREIIQKDRQINIKDK